MTEFLSKASGQYTFDCICAHWYGGAANTLEQDQSMIDAQMKEYASLASQYGIGEIVIGEMQRVNGDQEVRSPLPFCRGRSLCDAGVRDEVANDCGAL